MGRITMSANLSAVRMSPRMPNPTPTMTPKIDIAATTSSEGDGRPTKRIRAE